MQVSKISRRNAMSFPEVRKDALKRGFKSDTNIEEIHEAISPI